MPTRLGRSRRPRVRSRGAGRLEGSAPPPLGEGSAGPAARPPHALIPFAREVGGSPWNYAWRLLPADVVAIVADVLASPLPAVVGGRQADPPAFPTADG